MDEMRAEAEVRSTAIEAVATRRKAFGRTALTERYYRGRMKKAGQTAKLTDAMECVSPSAN